MSIAEQFFNWLVAAGGVVIMFAFVAYWLERLTKNE